MFHQCFEDLGFSYKEAQLDWSSLSIPANLYKVNLQDNAVSSVDTEAEDDCDDREDGYDEYVDDDETLVKRECLLRPSRSFSMETQVGCWINI